jgi:ribulose-phosphate 3-epimerase
MAVTPGFSGQKYIPSTSEKIIRLRNEAPNIEIVVDGGMHEDTIREVMTLGADACVVCSVIVKSDNWQAKIDQLKESGKIGSRNKYILKNGDLGGHVLQK